MSDRQETATVNEGTGDQDFTAGNSDKNFLTNEITVNLKTLEKCFNEEIDREMSNIVDTVEDRIQNAILTAIENINAPKIELVVRSVNASSGRDMASRITESEREERVGMTAPFENASGNNDVLHISKMNDEARSNIPGDVSELSVPESRFDRQSHTCHMVTRLSNATHHMVTGQTTHTIQFTELPTGPNSTPRNPPSHQHQHLSRQVSQDTKLHMV